MTLMRREMAAVLADLKCKAPSSKNARIKSKSIPAWPELLASRNWRSFWAANRLWRCSDKSRGGAKTTQIQNATDAILVTATHVTDDRIFIQLALRARSE